MIRTLLESAGLTCIATVGTSLGAYTDLFTNDEDKYARASTMIGAAGFTSATAVPSALITAIKSQDKIGYSGAKAITYIESCSNEEVNDMLNQIDELLDDNTNTHEDVKTLSRRI